MWEVVPVNFWNEASRGVIIEKTTGKALVPYIAWGLTIISNFEPIHFHSRSPSVRSYDSLESVKNDFETENDIQIIRARYDELVRSIVDDLTYCDLYYRKQKMQPNLRKAFMKQRLETARKKCIRILEKNFICDD